MSRKSNTDGALTCAICMEIYNEDERRPLLLPACGHTFCKLCLNGVIAKEGIKGQLLCPTCRRSQPVQATEDLPSNYSLLELSRTDSSSVYPSNSSRASTFYAGTDTTNTNELCSEHGSKLAFWCTTCEVAACGECLFEGHPRPEHHLARVEDHLVELQELMTRRSTRVTVQLTSILEENTSKVKDALVALVEFLRQRQVLKKLLNESYVARSIIKESGDLVSLSSVSETLKSLEKEFINSQIDSEETVSVMNPFEGKTTLVMSQSIKTIGKPAKEMVRESVEMQLTPRAISASDHTPHDDVASFPEPIDDLPSAAADVSLAVRRQVKTSSSPKPPLLARPALIPKPRTNLPSATPLPITRITPNHRMGVYSSKPKSIIEKVSVSTQTELPSSCNTSSTSSNSKTKTKAQRNSTQTTDCLPWPQMACGTLSSNWTSGKMTLEPKGIHVYSLEQMKKKCEVFLSLSVVSSLAPSKYPTVFLDLQEGSRPLGRVYIVLQIHLRRAQQFLSLCLGDRGPTYRGSFFHSIVKKGDSGEGLAGGDYDLKAGKGGSAVLSGLDPGKEIAKKCERGMVSRLTIKSETAAQFVISVRDGSRTKPVFPFGRVSQGINVVDEACKRPGLSVCVANCGCVLPFQ